ncbi:ABC transporter ATP-binding protein [Phyllobacterium lublinensis]|uniref:ABC transporter ATP-binding protein n=1 Tax=Phyllobacterium lublinensis TaxID=2875708 RepID=UPI001CCE6772|nr:ABC transporter ATP-binding protein [Phyllobacterium sp. 2063]MBZ9655256.1 ABC transporter ATP-binding protein [Phyllobacterium sp. 2063]
MTRQTPILSIVDLKVAYGGGGRAGNAVNGLSFDIMPGEAVALVGESGCGKSTTAHAAMRLLPDTVAISGGIRFQGRNLIEIPEAEMEAIRGNRIGMIFQEPMSSLNPVYRIGHQIAEAIRHHQQLDKIQVRKRVLELLDLVQLPEPQRLIDAYPHQLSGGQRQRVMIAMAVSCMPDLLIADEPTTALDATIQAQILELLDKLRRELSMSLLLISHNLPLVARWADNVIVMHHGEKMEALAASDLFTEARHPYTRGLQGASIRLDENNHYLQRPLAEIRSYRDSSGQYQFALNQRNAREKNRPPTAATSLLRVEGITIDYGDKRGRLTRAVDNVSFELAKAETLGLVGESGSGKSTLSRAIMQLVRPTSGGIWLDGVKLTGLKDRHLTPLRRNFQMIFQDPYSSLNPRRSVGDMLETTLVVHGVGDKVERQARVRGILDSVGLPATASGKYPHEFSGGQRQRIAIARALVIKPKLVVCDEPVSALDVSVQAQVLNLLVDLRHEFNLSYLFISHDLAVVRYISDRVMVMKDAKIIESGDHETIWRSPQHAYTRQLIAASA